MELFHLYPSTYFSIILFLLPFPLLFDDGIVTKQKQKENKSIQILFVLSVKCCKLQKLSERKVLRLTGFHPNAGKTFVVLFHLYW